MITKDDLLSYLGEIDLHLNQKVTLVAVGGTAMTLYGLKESTRDVDFCALTKTDQDLILSIDKKITKPFRLDLFREGYIFILQLPEDYVAKSKPFTTNFKNLSLRLLSPIDLIITKASRLNERDLEDIKSLVSKKRINKKKLIERSTIVQESYPGRSAEIQDRFEQVIKEFF